MAQRGAAGPQRRLGEFFDVCLIDTLPSLGVTVLSADCMLLPVVIGQLRTMKPKRCFMDRVANKVEGRKPRYLATVATVQQAHPQWVLPLAVGARDGMAEPPGEHRPVWKIKKSAARKPIQEVRALAAHVFEKRESAQ